VADDLRTVRREDRWEAAAPVQRERPATGQEVHTVWDGQAEKAFLRLRGGWLEGLGFVPGQELEIEERPGRLVIRTV
jgi:Toxin SymE, type I toxin-antitoxin system